MTDTIEIRAGLQAQYGDVYTPQALSMIHELAHLDADIKHAMRARVERRRARFRDEERIAFLDPAATIERTDLTVQAARDGDFDGCLIPHDLKRQWIQGTGPAAKPGKPGARQRRPRC